MEKGEIVIYQPDDNIKLEVRIDTETVWLNRQQIAVLFDRDVKTIGKHVNNALAQELKGESVVANFATVQKDRVTAQIITKTISNQFRLDLNRHNSQYPAINIEERNNIHDRFLIIDETVYHIGASLKDLGKKLFAFSKMELSSETILGMI
jgi:hypothetical protein